MCIGMRVLSLFLFSIKQIEKPVAKPRLRSVLKMYGEFPQLVEGKVRACIHHSLARCHQFKEKYYSTLQTAGLLIAFVLFYGGILFFRYRGKPTVEEMRQKHLEMQKQVLSKVREYQDVRLRVSQQLLTGLPHWDPPFVPASV